MQPIIEIKCYGKTTRVLFAGIDISKCLTSVEYAAINSGKGLKPHLKTDIDIQELLHLIDTRKIDAEKMREILESYMYETNLLKNMAKPDQENGQRETT